MLADLDLAATIHPWADQTEPEVPTVEESSCRLAICNMNWDYISAQDLMLLCNSFKPQHGTVISVTVSGERAVVCAQASQF